MGAEGFGEYSVAFALATVLSAFSLLGVPTLLVRETATYATGERWGDLQGLWYLAPAVTLAASLALAGIVLGVISWKPALFPGAAPATVALAMLLVPVMASLALLSASIRGMGQVVLGMIPEQLVRPICMLLGVSAIAMLSGSSELTPTTSLTMYVMATALAIIISLGILIHITPRAAFHGQASYIESRRWLGSLGPLGFLTVCQVLLGQTDILILSAFVEPKQLGLYRVAWQGAAIVSLILLAVGLAVEPEVARLHAQGKRAEVQRLVLRTGRLTAAIAAAVLLVFVLFGKWLLSTVFGAEYVAAHPLLVILAAGQFAFTLAPFSAIVLNMTRNERKTAKITGVATVLSILLSVALTSQFGAYGAAVSTSVSRFLWKLALARAAKRHADISTIILTPLRER